MGKRGWPKGRHLSAAHKRAIARGMMARSKKNTVRNKVARARVGAKRLGNRRAGSEKYSNVVFGGKGKGITIVTHRRSLTVKERATRGALLGATVGLASAGLVSGSLGPVFAANAASGGYKGYIVGSRMKRPGRIIKVRTVVKAKRSR